MIQQYVYIPLDSIDIDSSQLIISQLWTLLSSVDLESSRCVRL